MFKYKLCLAREESFEYIGKANDSNSAYTILKAFGATTEPEEKVWLLTISTNGEVTGIFEVAHGGISSAHVEIASIFKMALLANATSIILAHNHPSGDPTPSGHDYKLTRAVRQAGDILGIKLLDHIVVGYDSYESAL